MKATIATVSLALLVIGASAVPVTVEAKRAENLPDKLLIGSGYKRDNSVNADEYDLRSAWSKRDNSVNADEYDLRSAWSKA
ncbi:putative RxLR effector protein [Seiridium unicorne]|uniref:RxLR effector protein n=1 Tax=Seiridium unicorne TaxID=138068 RepID=A0ABR2VIK6_9PEZI